MTVPLSLPTYKRQRFLLTFIKTAGTGLTSIDLQKLLFLYHQESKETFFEFVPYLYGCYSLQAAQDVRTLESKGWLTSAGDQIQLTNSDFFPSEGYSLPHFFGKYPNLRGEELIRTVYRRYPYFAINSKIAEKVMGDVDLERIKAKRESLHRDELCLFTIGYEGRSLEQYLNLLIQKDVHVLCDVRNNPLSRKFGFSKGVLSHSLEKIGIEYRHLPELGIVSDKRKHLRGESDYGRIFSEYAEHLPSLSDSVASLHDLLLEKKRIAITCFEHDPYFCHRHVLSEFMEKKFNLETVNL